jgi:hypothetical protein
MTIYLTNIQQLYLISTGLCIVGITTIILHLKWRWESDKSEDKE